MSILVGKKFSLSNKLPGPISYCEGARLAYLASKLQDGAVVVEIGSNMGKSASFMAHGLQHSANDKAKIHCIDLWELDIKADERGKYASKIRHEKFEENLRGLGLWDYIVPHQAESVAVAAKWKQPIDLLFIDGGHEYEDVKADYEAWSKFVKVGGWIAFHDYFDKWPGLMDYVDRHVKTDGRWTEWRSFDRLLTGRRVK